MIKQERKTEKKQEKEIAYDNLYKFYSAKEMVLNGFKSKIFSIKSKGSGLLNTNQSNIDTKTNASKIANSSCTTKSR